MKRKKIIKKLKQLGFEVDGGHIYFNGQSITIGEDHYQQSIELQDIQANLKEQRVNRKAKEVTDYLGLTDKEQSK